VSLRDHDLDFWLSQLPEGSRWERGLIRDLFTALAELDAPADEFSRDVWRPSRLGYDYVEYRNADRLDFTAIGSAVNLVSRLEGLCRPLGRSVLISGAVAAETNTRLIPLGEHDLRGIATPCAVFTLPED